MMGSSTRHTKRRRCSVRRTKAELAAAELAAWPPAARGAGALRGPLGSTAESGRSGPAVQPWSLTDTANETPSALQALLLGVLNFKHPTLGYIHREIKARSSPGSTQACLRALTARLVPITGDLSLPRHRYGGAHVAREDGGGRREGGPGGPYRLPAHLRADRAAELRHQAASRAARRRWRLPLDRRPVRVESTTEPRKSDVS